MNLDLVHSGLHSPTTDAAADAAWSSHPVDPVRGCDLEPSAEQLEDCASSVIAAIRAAEEAGGVGRSDLGGDEPNASAQEAVELSAAELGGRHLGRRVTWVDRYGRRTGFVLQRVVHSGPGVTVFGPAGSVPGVLSPASVVEVGGVCSEHPAGVAGGSIRPADGTGGGEGVHGVDHPADALSGAEPTFVVVGPGFRVNAAELGDDQFSVTIGQLTLVLTRAEVEELTDALIAAVAEDDAALAAVEADEVATRALHRPGRMLLAASGQTIAEGPSLYAVMEERFGFGCTYHPGHTTILGDIIGFDGRTLARIVWA